MKHKLLAILAVGLLAGPTAANAAPTLIVDTGSGKLVGISGVDVGGTLYNAEFADGTCVAVFSGCDALSDFTFQSEADAITASQAIHNAVQGTAFDVDPAMTFGCSNSVFCFFITPYDVGAGVFIYAIAINSNDVDQVQSPLTTEVTYDTSGDTLRTLVKWSLAQPDAAQMLSDLRDDSVGKGPGKSLADKIALAQVYYAANDISATCAVLDDFINEVTALLRARNKRGATQQLVDDANAIKVAIGCD